MPKEAWWFKCNSLYVRGRFVLHVALSDELRFFFFFHFVRCQGQSPQEKMLSMFKSPIQF